MFVTNRATSLFAIGLKKVLLYMADLSMPGAPVGELNTSFRWHSS